MRILPKPVRFEWDKGNKDKNLRKHGVTDRESEEVFINKPLLVSLDSKHKTKTETRYHALGRNNEGTVLFITFTVRNDKVRIISSRKANKKERSKYAKKI